MVSRPGLFYKGDIFTTRFYIYTRRITSLMFCNSLQKPGVTLFPRINEVAKLPGMNNGKKIHIYFVTANISFSLPSNRKTFSGQTIFPPNLASFWIAH